MRWRDLESYYKLFSFWGSYKVVDSESFNFYSLGFWASEEFGVLREPNTRTVGFDGSLQGP